MSSTSSTPPPPPPPKKVTVPVRDLLVLLASGAAGVGADQLLIFSSVPFGQAVIGGFAAFGGVFYFLDRITV